MWHAPAQVSATAQILDCHRIGPISGNGLGYWWECEATVDVSDGRVVHTMLHRSVAGPQDVGKKITVQEACSGDFHTECGYGRPASKIWAVVVALLGLLKLLVTASFGFLGVGYLLGALLGARLTNRLIGHNRHGRALTP